jgi:hypothetical protein
MRPKNRLVYPDSAVSRLLCVALWPNGSICGRGGCGGRRLQSATPPWSSHLPRSLWDHVELLLDEPMAQRGLVDLQQRGGRDGWCESAAAAAPRESLTISMYDVAASSCMHHPAASHATPSAMGEPHRLHPTPAGARTAVDELQLPIGDQRLHRGLRRGVLLGPPPAHRTGRAWVPTDRTAAWQRRRQRYSRRLACPSAPHVATDTRDQPLLPLTAGRTPAPRR